MTRSIVHVGVHDRAAPCVICGEKPLWLAYPTKGKVRSGVCELCARTAVEMYNLRTLGKTKDQKRTPFRRRFKVAP